MEKTFYIPDELWEQLTTYLQTHPHENLSSVIQSALTEKLRPRNGAKLIELVGIVENAPQDASTRED